MIHRFYPCKLFLWTARSAHNLKKIFVICSGPFSCFLASCRYIHFPENLIWFPSYICKRTVWVPLLSANNKDQYYIINLLVLLAKYQIHKSKFFNHKPFFFSFLRRSSNNSLQQTNTINRKASNLSLFCLMWTPYCIILMFCVFTHCNVWFFSKVCLKKNKNIDTRGWKINTLSGN